LLAGAGFVKQSPASNLTAVPERNESERDAIVVSRFLFTGFVQSSNFAPLRLRFFSVLKS
jgi:hypothetical protein